MGLRSSKTSVRSLEELKTYLKKYRCQNIKETEISLTILHLEDRLGIGEVIKMLREKQSNGSEKEKIFCFKLFKFIFSGRSFWELIFPWR